MIEIEFSALSRLCLNRHIPNQEQLAREVLALVQERERKGIQIHCSFPFKKPELPSPTPTTRSAKTSSDLQDRLLLNKKAHA